MHIFKTALAIFFRHPVSILIYVVYLGLMGVFVASAAQGAPSESFEQQQPASAVIDRDGSPLAQGVARQLAQLGQLVPLQDTETALQDAIAQQKVDAIVIVPAGFGDAFMRAAHEGAEPPMLQTVLGINSATGYLVENEAQTYLACAAVQAGIDTQVAQQQVAQTALEAMGGTVDAAYALDAAEASPISENYLLFNRWETYPIICSLGVLVSLTLVGFNRGNLRRRNLSSPRGSVRFSLSLAAAAVFIMLVVWGWLALLGCIAYHGELASVEAWRIALIAVTLLFYCLFGLAFGFLLSQCGVGDLAANAASNIVGLVLSFVGGSWIPLSYMDDTLRTVASFTPPYWQNASLSAIAQAPDATWASIAPAVGGWAMMALFAAALFAAALVVGRVRLSKAYG